MISDKEARLFNVIEPGESAVAHQGYRRRRPTETHSTNPKPPTSVASAGDGSRRLLLQVVQPGLAGLMDGAVSTLAPIFATAFATGRPFTAFLVGMAFGAQRRHGRRDQHGLLGSSFRRWSPHGTRQPCAAWRHYRGHDILGRVTTYPALSHIERAGSAYDRLHRGGCGTVGNLVHPPPVLRHKTVALPGASRGRWSPRLRRGLDIRECMNAVLSFEF